MYTDTYIYTYMYIYIYTYMCVYIYMYMFTYIYVYLSLYISPLPIQPRFALTDKGKSSTLNPKP